MRNRLLIALLSGTIAYIIIVLSGLLLNLALRTILLKGIAGLLLLGAGSWLLSLILTKIPIEEVQEEEDHRDFTELDPLAVESVSNSADSATKNP